MTSDRRDPTLATRSVDRLLGSGFDVREFRRRNPRAVLLDALLVFLTAFFGYMATRGIWPALVAAIPLGGLLYLGLRASRAFFVAQLIGIGVAVVLGTVGASVV